MEELIDIERKNEIPENKKGYIEQDILTLEEIELLQKNANE